MNRLILEQSSWKGCTEPVWGRGRSSQVEKYIQVISTTTEAQAIHQEESVEKNKCSERAREDESSIWGGAACGNISAVKALTKLCYGETDEIS